MLLPNRFLEDIKIIYHLFQPVRGNTHKERLESFYSGQAQLYDAFRKRLLKGREELFKSLSLSEGGIWIDMGGGTGANFECIADRLAKIEKVYIVDLCPSLLKVARERIANYHWCNVEAIEDDSTQFVPKEGTADVVIFSYSLTMMPDWFAVIDHAQKILKPGGIIGVVDFYVSRKHPKLGFCHHPWLVRAFWQTWFAKDNVFLSPEHLAYLHYRFLKVSCTENIGTVPLMLGLKVPYYLFIGRKKL